MANCVNTIKTISPIELISKSSYKSTLTLKENSLYLLANGLAQSVLIYGTAIPSISTLDATATVTIYNKLDLNVVGSSNITRNNFSFSFTLPVGNYYICIKTLTVSTKLNFVAEFKSYKNQVTFGTNIGNCSIGFTCSSNLEVYKVNITPMECSLPMTYEIIDGELPIGLKMSKLGYISGILPILDCDPYNDELPPSNLWYQINNDENSSTTYTRLYYFTVKLTLDADTTKTHERRFYISIIADFTTNIQKVQDIVEITNQTAMYDSTPDYNLTNGLCDNICKTKIDLPEIIRQEEMPFKVSTEKKEIDTKLNKDFYNNIENNKPLIDDFDNIYTSDSNYTYINEYDVEMISIDDNGFIFNENNIPLINGKYETGNKLMMEYYVRNYTSLSDFIIQLKSSCMFQQLLYEQNINNDYIIEDIRNIHNYIDVVFKYISIDNNRYIHLEAKNVDIANKNKTLINPYEVMYKNEYDRLPILTYARHGYTGNASLYVKGK